MADGSTIVGAFVGGSLRVEEGTLLERSRTFVQAVREAIDAWSWSGSRIRLGFTLSRNPSTVAFSPSSADWARRGRRIRGSLHGEATGGEVDVTRILLVEDSEMNRDLLSRRLGRRGYEVVMAVHGEQGLATAAAEAPAPILMDTSLPGVDDLDTRPVELERLLGKLEALPRQAIR